MIQRNSIFVLSKAHLRSIVKHLFCRFVPACKQTPRHSAAYTAGLGVSNITKIPNKPLVLVSGAIGTGLAVWLYYNFVGMLNLLSGMIPPVGAVLILHYFMHRDEYEENAKAEIRAVNMPAILAVVAGSLVGVFVTAGIKPVNSLFVAAVVFVIADRLCGKRG